MSDKPTIEVRKVAGAIIEVMQKPQQGSAVAGPAVPTLPQLTSLPAIGNAR